MQIKVINYWQEIRSIDLNILELEIHTNTIGTITLKYIQPLMPSYL